MNKAQIKRNYYELLRNLKPNQSISEYLKTIIQNKIKNEKSDKIKLEEIDIKETNQQCFNKEKISNDFLKESNTVIFEIIDNYKYSKDTISLCFTIEEVIDIMSDYSNIYYIYENEKLIKIVYLWDEIYDIYVKYDDLFNALISKRNIFYIKYNQNYDYLSHNDIINDNINKNLYDLNLYSIKVKKEKGFFDLFSFNK